MLGAFKCTTIALHMLEKLYLFFKWKYILQLMVLLIPFCVPQEDKELSLETWQRMNIFVSKLG